MDMFNFDSDVALLLLDLSVEELQSFSRDQRDQVELYIYSCFLLFTRTQSTDYLEQAILRAREWVDQIDTGHPDRTRRLQILDTMVASLSQLNQFSSGPEHAEGRTSSMDELDMQLFQALQQFDLYKETRNISDLEPALESTENLISLAPRTTALTSMGLMLMTQFQDTGSIDLNRAARLTDVAMEASEQDIAGCSALLSQLRPFVVELLEQTSSETDFSRAIKVSEMLVNAAPNDSNDRADQLDNLGGLWATRFKRTGSVDDLNQAIKMTDIAVKITPEGHPHRATYLSNLGNWFMRRSERRSSGEDLERAIELQREASKYPLDHSPNRAYILGNLGGCLGTLYKQTSLTQHLNEAILVTEKAEGIIPQNDPQRPVILNNLGTWLALRFESNGSKDDLDQAIRYFDLAVQSVTPSHPSRTEWFIGLSVSLGRRFEQTGSTEDLNRAIDLAEKVVGNTAEGNHDYCNRLSNLSNWLGRRFSRTHSINDLTRAIEYLETAVQADFEDHQDRGNWFGNLGAMLNLRFKETHSTNDLNRAIEVMEDSLRITQDGFRRAAFANTLAISLARRFDVAHALSDLERAIATAQEAVQDVQEDAFYRASILNNIGDWLETLFQRTHEGSHLDLALSFYQDAWNCQRAPPSDRILPAKNAARILASRNQWVESSALLEEAVKLLPNVSPRSLKHTDKQHKLADFSGLSSIAAATALNAGKEPWHALQLLELGRGVIASLLMEMRGDVSELEKHHHDLAAEFVALRKVLDSATSYTGLETAASDASSWESRVRGRREEEEKFNLVIARIRAQPGFHNFLLPPSKEELMAAASPDPIVVVNLSDYRCDSIIVEKNQITALNLPHLTISKARDCAREMRGSRTATSSGTESLLAWLWEDICRPILDVLGFDKPICDDDWPRVWWVPTGVLSQLPLHAAGHQGTTAFETVLDRVMSSYAPSIKALRHGRRQSRISVMPNSSHAVLAAMQNTPGLPANGYLPFASDEVEMVKAICPALKLKPVTPTLQQKDILEHLQGCKIFHFAGHGQADPTEPSQSCLLLEDWQANPLTVGDLRDHKLHENPPFLGYLSACSTGTNEVDKLADEGIHLVSALQLAGFRHVVGTLFPVSDKCCIQVARILYQTLQSEGMNDEAVCRGLHFAIRALRGGHIEQAGERKAIDLYGSATQGHGLRNKNNYWIPYVHFGA